MEFLGKLETFYNVLKKVANNDFLLMLITGLSQRYFFSFPSFLY